MHLSTLLTYTILATRVAASPINLHTRAGAPPITPVPSNCTISNPLPDATNATNNNQVSGYRASTNFTTAHEIYAAYFDATLDQSAEVQQCLEQCYGYGGSKCKSAMLAYDVAVPTGYDGGPGGGLATACLMYDEFLETQDFVLAKEGGFVNETVGNLGC